MITSVQKILQWKIFKKKHLDSKFQHVQIRKGTCICTQKGAPRFLASFDTSYACIFFDKSLPAFLYPKFKRKYTRDPIQTFKSLKYSSTHHKVTKTACIRQTKKCYKRNNYR